MSSCSFDTSNFIIHTAHLNYTSQGFVGFEATEFWNTVRNDME